MYQRPYSKEEIIKNYSSEVATKLLNDPIHSWRAETGIELVHKEPTKRELERIWKNWNEMSEEMKQKSDEKSFELFGKTNREHYDIIIGSY